jgi:hypothetical protein
MMNEAIKVSKKQIPAMLLKAFPDYTGRKFKIEVRKSYFMQNYWSEGTRYYCKAVNMTTGEIVDPSYETQNPFRQIAHSTIEIPVGVCIVEHVIFQGKDLGLRFNIREENLTKFLENK